jgi:hypothetical protein
MPILKPFSKAQSFFHPPLSSAFELGGQKDSTVRRRRKTILCAVIKYFAVISASITIIA